MKFFNTLSTLLILGTGFSACLAEEGTPTVSVSLDNYCKEVADVACYNMWHCCTGAQIENMLGITISVEPAECKRDVQLLCEDSEATLLWAADRGSVQLTESTADACLLSMLLDGDCFQHVDDVPWQHWCKDSYWRGVLTSGQDCLYNFECQEGTYCAADRKCRDYPQEGEDCPGYVCAPNLFCNPVDDRCEAQGTEGFVCQANDWCVEDLYCQSADEGPSTCTSYKALGVDCQGHYQCESDFCLPGLCSNGTQCFEDSDCSGTCSRSGDYCGSDYDCAGECQNSGYYCQSDMDCDADEICLTDFCDQKCQGESVCAENWTVIDYCTDTLGMLL